MKQRFSSLDIKVISHELSNRLVSLRLANIYDLSSRIFLLKFAKPEHREQLIIDSGFRCHLTSFARATAAAPSPFVARLRKFLRTRRVTAVQQIGTDRVLEIQFSDGAYRLFLEFYAGGNIVLTDQELTIIGLLRSVNEGEEHEQYRMGVKYGLSDRQNYEGVPPLTRQRLKDGLERAIERQALEAQKPGKKVKKKAGDALRKALAITTTEFPPVLIDHGLHVAGVDRALQPEQVVSSENLLDTVLKALGEARRVVEEITSKDTAKGYILAKRKGNKAQEDSSHDVNEDDDVMYDDFHPFKPAQLVQDDSVVFIETDGFNLTVDKFFSSIEGQKLESRLQEREDHAKRKIEQARNEQAKRLDGLQHVQELNERKAQAIEANVERVEEAVAAVNGLVAQGMDWEDIGRLINNEQNRRNPVAQLIKLPLKLHENTVTLLLSEIDAEVDDEMDATDSEPSDSDGEDDRAAPSRPTQTDDKRLTIDIDLALSAWANARQYHDQRRSAAVKQERTAQAAQKALKSTEQKVLADLKKGLKQEKDILRPVRKQFWFEKFIYFISSDGYLVLAGRDAQQNEMLYRRYLRKGDIYVHADLHGAASVIIKNNPSTPDAPIPPSTLSQAGNLAVCTSSAWESKAVMSAWWVNSDQVSKTAPTGEYLTTGGFMIRGKKNYLPPAQLLLGFAMIFHISEESKAQHMKHRLQNLEDRPTTPELTDGETIAESSIAGDGPRDTTDSDDDFPDAAPVPAPRTGDEDDDDDDFPDATHGPGDISDDDFPDTQRRRSYGSDEEGDGRAVASSSNPLLSTHFASPDQELDHEGDDEKDGQMHPDDDEDDEDEIEEDGETHAEDESTVTPDTQAPTDSNTDAPELESEAPTLSNKERKAAQRAEKGKPTAPEPKPKAKPVRGKKGKAKKMATKYAHQDEEDRALAMKLLGSRAADEKRAADARAKASQPESAEDARARRRAQHERAQREGLEAEEIRRLTFEEGGAGGADDGDESAASTPLDALVGRPLPGDEILEAIPVCAPWAALAKFKYKAKMQPGQQKKGKAVREVLGRWVRDGGEAKKVDGESRDVERIWPRELELLKGWKEAEVVGVIPVKQVRVMMSGGGGAGGEKGRGGGKGGRGGKGSKRR